MEVALLVSLTPHDIRRVEVCVQLVIMDYFRTDKERIQFYRSLVGDDRYKALNEILRQSESTVFLGGAGVSTESGIPDFRSKNGLYRKKDHRFGKYRPEYLLSARCLKKEPALFFEYCRKNLDCRTAEPNSAHKVLAKMEQAGLIAGIITQNIDGLHQKAGSKNVQEIHGSVLRSYCISCHTEYGSDFIFNNYETIPLCPSCGKMIRPDITLYGEMLPANAYESAISLIRYADCLIIGGTSLEVGSAAQLAHMYHGRHLIIINKGKTKLEGRAELVFHDSIGATMEQIII